MGSLTGDVRERYGAIAETADTSGSCCESDHWYSPEELAAIPEGAELGLGTGNPVGQAEPAPGETVVDLGSGAGVDVFLAAQAVGPDGRAIGIDVTPEMVARARRLGQEAGIDIAEFVLAPIENVPLPDGVADVIVSNCVVNLSEDKTGVLEEAFRLLGPGGRLVISDTLQIEVTEHTCGCGCAGNALTEREWTRALRAVGFSDVQVENRAPDGRFGPDVGTVLVRASKPSVNP